MKRRGSAANAYAVCSAAAERSKRKGSYANPHRLKPGDVVVVEERGTAVAYVVGPGHRRRK